MGVNGVRVVQLIGPPGSGKSRYRREVWPQAQKLGRRNCWGNEYFADDGTLDAIVANAVVFRTIPALRPAECYNYGPGELTLIIESYEGREIPGSEEIRFPRKRKEVQSGH